MSDLFERLRTVKTMPELDSMRREVVFAMKEASEKEGEIGFNRVQGEFIKAKNRLKRIPLKERTSMYLTKPVHFRGKAASGRIDE